MAERKEDVLGISPATTSGSTQQSAKSSKVKNVVHLWEKDVVNLLNGISLAAVADREFESADRVEKSDDVSEPVMPVIRMSDQMYCVTCDAEFEERSEQIQHYRSDWHRFNLKRRLREVSVVSEQEFEVLTNAGDLSSISGSDRSSDEEDQAKVKSSAVVSEDLEEGGGHIEGIGKRHPRVFLRNTDGELLSIYRCVIHSKKSQADTAESLLSMVHQLPAQKRWCILMLAGGHFAAALFDGDTVIEHKTFHRYVVRAKRGTVQSSRDNKGSAPKSGGASIRRYNEAALSREIQELMTAWTEPLKQCHRIFLRVPTSNKAVVFSGKLPIFDKKDPRIRLIPIQTRRPTFKEIKRVHDILSSVECYGTESQLKDHITSSPKKPADTNTEKPSALDSTTRKLANGNEPSADKVEDWKSSENCEAESDEEDGDIDLLTETVTMDTSHLQPFEMAKRPAKKKKPRKAPDGVEQINRCEETESNNRCEVTESTELYALRNDLYTSCKVKDSERFSSLLNKLSMDYGTVNSNHCKLSDKHEEIKGTIPGTVQEESAPDMSSDISPGTQPDALTIVNRPFGSNGTTLLMVAAESDHKDAVTLLMKAGADPTIKDNQGRMAYNVASSKDTRNEFRRFMSQFPDMYDYGKAQIPGPLSNEQEKTRKDREAQRKKAMKKVKKDRLKDQKELEAKEREENREKQRYLSLSDREKRALAAERRLTTQATSEGGMAPVLSRCFQCGVDITGKVPFEYINYKFCTTKCLKEHRAQKHGQKTS